MSSSHFPLQTTHIRIYRGQRNYAELARFSTVLAIVMLIALAAILPHAITKSRTANFEDALEKCTQGFQAYCNQISAGGAYVE